MPRPVVRGIAVAAVAAAGVTGGAAALTAPGTDTRATPTSTPRTAAAAAPEVLSAAGRAAMVVPAPGLPVPGAPGVATAPVPAVPGEPGVLDPSAVGRAVARAQADARRIVEDRKAQEERARAEERRTAERARRAGRAAAEPGGPSAPATAARPPSGCGLDTGSLGAVKAHVRAAATFLGCRFGEPEVLGVAGRAGASDHPDGLALDFMVDRATGDAIAACAIRNRAALGITYVIWRQRIDHGDGFRPMEDRGNPTANHFDHVHISFARGAGGDPAAC